jgi:hypothetical protein
LWKPRVWANWANCSNMTRRLWNSLLATINEQYSSKQR